MRRLCVSNTQRNIETIGLLGGSLSADGSSFNINTLIIPKQKGETDRVEMLKEEEIWDIFFQVRDKLTMAVLSWWTCCQRLSAMSCLPEAVRKQE